MSSGYGLSFLMLHHIVVTGRVWCRRELIFLREELIEEGLAIATMLSRRRVDCHGSRGKTLKNRKQKVNTKEQLALALHRNCLILLGELPPRQIVVKLL